MAAQEEAEAPQLPPQFFTPPDGFDSVRHMLENLPEEEGLSLGFLHAQTAETQTVLDAINSQLSARVMRSYGAFVHGMAQVQTLESDLVLTAILCRSARRHLGHVQSGMVHGGLRFLSSLRRRRVMECLASTLRSLSCLSGSLGDLERLLKLPSLLTALPQVRSSLPPLVAALYGEGRRPQLASPPLAAAAVVVGLARAHREPRASRRCAGARAVHTHRTVHAHRATDRARAARTHTHTHARTHTHTQAHTHTLTCARARTHMNSLRGRKVR